jgi:anti-anti-sigma factor
MPAKAEEYNNICVLSLGGDLSGVEPELLRKQVEEFIDHKQITDFVIDFEKASFLDSEGLEALLWMKRKCEDLFGKVKLTNLDETCRKILQITRLEPRFECHPDLPTALKNMR